MAKHVTAADMVLKGKMSKMFKHLGKFMNRKILEQGHNSSHPGSSLAECLAKCEKMSIIRKRACETNCAIEG